MINRNHIDIKTLVEEQLPGFVLDTNTSVLPKFLEYYYDFMESEEEQNNFTRDILKYFDSFRTTEDVLNWNFEEVSKIPHKTATDKKKFAKRVYDFYKTKGTEESIKLLFRAFYDKDISITYPSKNILRASDGRWSRESEILVRLSMGTIDNLSEVTFSLVNSKNQTLVKTASRVERVGNTNDYWMTFGVTQKIQTEPDNIIYGNDENDTIVFLGKVLHTPNKLSVSYGGRGFRVGQIFRIPGTYRDSVFKVTSTGAMGKILACELIQFGYGHAENLTIDLSPFKGLPTPTSVVYGNVSIGTGLHHSLNINDAVYQINDRVVGGNFVVDSNVNEQTSGLPSASIGLTIGAYLDSVAKIKIVSGGVSAYPGKWSSSDGRINSPDIVLQDNYYYQPFSYVIHGDVNLTEYQDTVLNITHPAGMKIFADMEKTISFDASLGYEISALRRHTLLVDDFISATDTLKKHVFKFFDEGVIAEYVDNGYVDDGYVLPYAGNIPITYVSDQIDKHVTKPFVEVVPATDYYQRTTRKVLSDSAVATDVKKSVVSKNLVDSTITSDFIIGDSPGNLYVADSYVSDYINNTIDMN